MKFLYLLIVSIFFSSQALAQDITLYTSIDEPFFTPLIKRFEQQSGLKVRVLTDGEATKTAGLAERLLAEKTAPKADVYWGNEPFHTLRLASQDLFTPYTPPAASSIPDRWKSPENLYTPIGLRARVLGLSTRPKFKDLTANIKTLEDLGDPKLKDKIAICSPTTGTAAGHFAALYCLWGESKYTAVLMSWRANNIKLLGGNSVVANQVAYGNLTAGATDNDDVHASILEGGQIAPVLPNQSKSDIGTLLIPSTIALVKNAPHQANAKKLIDFLTTPEIEQQLLKAHFLAYTTRDAQTVHAMNLDYKAAAAAMRTATELALKILQDRP